MKKTLLLIGCLVVLSLGIIAISCSKSTGVAGVGTVKYCDCTLTGNWVIAFGGPTAKLAISASTIYGSGKAFETCAELSAYLNENPEYGTASCK